MNTSRPFQVCRTCLLILVILSLANCASKKLIEVGELPPPLERPNRAVVENTRQLISNQASTEGARLISTGKDYQRVRVMADRLTKAAGITQFSFPVLIASNTETVNAYVADGNTIVVYEGLMQKTSDDEELAAIIGHEIAHALARHHEDTTVKDRSKVIGIGSTILGGIAAVGVIVAGGGGGAANLAGSLTDTAASAVGLGSLALSYSRDMELEADRIGLTIMARADYDPRKSLSFWARADEVFGGSGGGFLSTHPGNESRKEEIEAMLPQILPLYEASRRDVGKRTKTINSKAG